MAGKGVLKGFSRDLNEGPYYKAGSPERTVTAEKGTTGEKLVLQGSVFNGKGKPVSGAWLDFWQGDGKGEYDNTGFNLRGHQFTDKKGKYRLETVVPGGYSFRTPHIHVKVRANPASPVLTTQLFFPGQEKNLTDHIFDPAMVMKVSNTAQGKRAKFDFVIDMAGV